MYICMYVCMCICMFVCMYVRMYICTCICMYVCMYACTYVRICYVHTYVRTYISTYLHMMITPLRIYIQQVSLYCICSKLHSLNRLLDTVPLKDSIALAHSSQITIHMIDTLSSMHFSHTFSFIVHRMLDKYYLNINSVKAWSDSRVLASYSISISPSSVIPDILQSKPKEQHTWGPELCYLSLNNMSHVKLSTSRHYDILILV